MGSELAAPTIPLADAKVPRSGAAGAYLSLVPASVMWFFLFVLPLGIFVVYGFFRTGILDIEYVLSFDAYVRVLTDRLYLDVILRTATIAL